MRKIIIMAAMLGALTACEKAGLSAVEEIGGGNFETPVTKKFTFTIKGDFTNPEFTRANSYMTADGVEMTDLWVVDVKDGNVVQSLHQGKDDADWGEPSMALTLGTHHVMFLASRGTGAQYNEGVVTWTKAHDTFYCDYEVTVVKTSNGNRAVTLDRCVTKLMLTIDDAVPVGTTSLAFVPGTWYSGWNMLTGEPVAAPEGYNVTFSLPQSYGGATGTAYAVYSLSGKDEWTTDVAVTSKAGEAVNASVTLTDVPLKANRASVYHGTMYSNNAASSVSLSTEWLTQYEGVY